MNGAEMIPLAEKLWGKPTRTRRHELRFGRSESKSLDLDRAEYHDFETGKGGGYRQLYKLAHGQFPPNGEVPRPRVASKPEPEEKWEPMIPPPADAPRPSDRDLACDCLHEYVGPDDRLLFYVRRHEATPTRRKQFYPLTYGRLTDKNGTRVGWHNNAPESPRPLFGLNRLSTRPDAPVLICEGEKSADAAQLLFPDYACIAWMGGTPSVEAADWKPVAGRNVTLWPDADERGKEAMAKLAKQLPHARTLNVNGLEDGFDAADLLEQGCDDPEAWLWAKLPGPEALLHERVGNLLDLNAWDRLTFPPERRFLGSVLSSLSSRLFLVGATGLGKSQFALAMAMGIASGRGFLGWECDNPARVLLIDGEMSPQLVQARLRGARAGQPGVPADQVFTYSVLRSDAIAEAAPEIGPFAPLNTEEGHAFVKRLIAAVRPDVVIFDNVMSLLDGDQKDEVSWSGAMPLVKVITALGIPQVWLDHAGHNRERQYGSNTKAWPFDTVGMLTDVDDRPEGEIAFRLSFDRPAGKARNRTPDNCRQFSPHTIRMTADGWSAEPEDADRKARGKKQKGMTENQRMVLEAIHEVFADPQLPKQRIPIPGMAPQGTVARAEVRDRLRVVGEFFDDHTDGLTPADRGKLREAINSLKKRNIIGSTKDLVWLL